MSSVGNTKKFVVKNGLISQNVEFISPDTESTITQTMLDNGTLSFDGSAGQLFSITDSLEGVIFSVNLADETPVIEVDDDGTVRISEYTGNILIGTSSDDGTNKLQVDGRIKGIFDYDNTVSGLSADNVKDAIDELTDIALQSGDNVSELTNDANYIDASGAPVQSVNGQTGVVVIETPRTLVDPFFLIGA